jgi:O-methyltransferase
MFISTDLLNSLTHLKRVDEVSIKIMLKYTVENTLKSTVKKLLTKAGYNISRLPEDIPNIPDVEFYRPVFSPWLGYGDWAEFYNKAKPYTLVSSDRCWVLYVLATQALKLTGEFWECGVYQGGTAIMLSKLIDDKAPLKNKIFRLFDTFEGMPETDAVKDVHKKGDFSNTSLESVSSRIGYPEFVRFHKGFIPDTFKGLEKSKIAFAHIDVDIYQSVIDCCEFIYPQLVIGGFMVFDDYGFPSCPGARQAVDEFFRATNLIPLSLPTGQAIVFKSCI